jgi:hypothetical protein
MMQPNMCLGNVGNSCSQILLCILTKLALSFFSESENVLTPTAITECLEGIQFSFYGSNHVKEKYPSLEMKTLALCFSFPNIMIVVQGA